MARSPALSSTSGPSPRPVTMRRAAALAAALSAALGVSSVARAQHTARLRDARARRRALSQPSGLRDVYVMMAQTGRTFEGDTIDALRVITRSAEPNYEPGARYLYTNSGWILAARIVYRLSGKTHAQFADERLFAPLGMHDTRYQADAASIIPSGAEGYAPRSSGGGFRVARSSYDGAIMGAGAVHTSGEDFGRWLNNYDAATEGGRDTIEMMTAATTLNDGAPARAGPNREYPVGPNVGTRRGR